MRSYIDEIYFLEVNLPIICTAGNKRLKKKSNWKILRYPIRSSYSESVDLK